MLICEDLDAFFIEVFSDLNCRPDTRAYLINLYSHFNSTVNDLSQYNITILHLQARHNNNFCDHQKIADYIFFIKTVLPEYFNSSNDYYENIARLSYYSCYKLINRQWPLFEQLADDFRILELEARKRINQLKYSTTSLAVV